MLSGLIARTAMGLAAAIIAAIGLVFSLIGGFYLLGAWIGPGPAGLALGGALLLVAFCLATFNRGRQGARTPARADNAPLSALALMQGFWKERPLLCLGLISAAGLIVMRRPKTLTDLAALAMQFMRPPAPGA